MHAGRPPKIIIPLASPDEVSRWSVFVEELSDSATKRRKRVSIDEIVGSESGRNLIKVPLDDERLLGETCLGIYRVKARGPLGRDKQFEFAYVKQLEYEFDQEIYLEGDRINLTLLVDPHIEIESNENGTEVKGKDGVFEVISTSNTRNLELKLRLGEITLPLSFRIPRLRWTLHKEREPLAWNSDTIEIQIEDLEAGEVNLRVQVPLPDGSVAELRLDGADHVVREEVRNGKVQFCLRQFLDSLRNLCKLLACFSLCFTGTQLEGRSLSPLRVRTGWVVESFNYEYERGRETCILLLGWQDRGRVRNRRLRLWDLWRPWRKPFIFYIQDDECELEIELPTCGLPPGIYRAEFYVEDEYCTDRSPLFVPGANANVFDVEIEKDREIAAEGSAFQRWLTHRLAGEKGALDLTSMSIGPEDAESLIHAMVVDQEKALWQALPETIRQSLQNHLREAIKRWAEECGNNEKALLLEICKICRVCDQSLMPFKIEEKVRIEGKTVEYRGIEYYEDEQGDVIQLRYSDSERKIPIRCIDIDIDIDKLSKERDDAPLSKQESKRRTTKKG